MALLSQGRLSKMMLEILSEFPSGTKNLKENVTLRLGLIGQMSTTRDINAAWNDGNVKIVDKKISSTNYKKLNDLANNENCSVDALISRLVSYYKKNKK